MTVGQVFRHQLPASPFRPPHFPGGIPSAVPQGLPAPRAFRYLPQAPLDQFTVAPKVPRRRACLGPAAERRAAGGTGGCRWVPPDNGAVGRPEADHCPKAQAVRACLQVFQQLKAVDCGLALHLQG